MGEFSELLGDKVAVVVGEKTYYLSRLTDTIRSEYERFLEVEALKCVQRNKEILGEDYLSVLTDTNSKIASGHFSFGSPAYNQSTRTMAGLVYLLWLLLRGHQEITEGQTRQLIAEHMPELTAGIKAALGITDTAEDVKKKFLTPI